MDLQWARMSISRQFIRLVRGNSILLLLGALAVGCESTAVGSDSSTETGVQPGSYGDGLEKWGCGDSIDGCMFRCPVTLTADLNSNTGTVTIGGVVEYTRFELHGLERRWDWCLDADGVWECALVVRTDGTGLYYNFRGTMPDSDGTRRTEPSNLFKCRRMKVERPR